LPVPHPLLLWLLSGLGPSIITAFSVGTAPPLPTKIAPDGGTRRIPFTTRCQPPQTPRSGARQRPPRQPL